MTQEFNDTISLAGELQIILFWESFPFNYLNIYCKINTSIYWTLMELVVSAFQAGGIALYNVILVEDEMLVRMGLKNSIDWGKYGMRIAADFTNGRTALEYYEKNKPDIIITDLKMRVMDGMTLISKIREKDRDTRIIILTCLEEFELVRKAMSMGVSDYIPKLTMTDEEIDNVLKKTRNELDLLKKDQTKTSSGSRYPEMDREVYFKEFLLYGLHTAEEFRNFAGQSEMKALPEKLVLCLLEIDGYDQMKKRYEDEDGHLIKMSMLNVLSEVLENNKRADVFHENGSRYILLIGAGDIVGEHALYNEINAILGSIRDAVDLCFNISVSIGVSSSGSGYESLRRLYGEARQALSNKFYAGAGLTIFYDKKIGSDSAARALAELTKIPDLNQILGCSGAKEFTNRIESFTTMLPVSQTEIKRFFLQLIQWISHVACTGTSESIADAVSASDSIKSGETLKEMVDSLTGFFTAIQKSRLEKRTLSKEITDAIHYLRLNFDRDINLQQVADCVNLSPNYLSNLFKKELRVNFTDYLRQLRIEKAKELLLGTYMKSYEISEKTGFTDNAYFSKVFKKYTGVSPNEFRKKWMKGWTEEVENEED